LDNTVPTTTSTCYRTIFWLTIITTNYTVKHYPSNCK